MLLGRRTRDPQDTRSPSEVNSYATVLNLRKGIEDLKHSIHSRIMETAAHQTLLMGNTGVYLEATGHVYFTV